MKKYRFFLGKLPKSELAMVVALSGCPDSAERQALLGDVQQRIVDRRAAGNRTRKDLITPSGILAVSVMRISISERVPKSLEIAAANSLACDSISRSRRFSLSRRTAKEGAMSD